MPPYAHKLTALFIFFLVLFFGNSLFNNILINVYPGEIGVLWKRFDNGTDSRVYGEGLHVINPFNVMYKYDIRIQQRETSFSVLSNNGLDIEIEASMRFNLIRDQVYLLHKTFGPDYTELLVVPETQAVIRRVIGEYEAQAIYSAQGEIQKVSLSATGELLKAYIQLDDLIINDIRLPKFK